jgi:Flp pilus assembly protein TadG
MKRRHDGVKADKHRGLAAVELATCLPLLTLICLGICDFSRVFYDKVALNNCARNGALFANNPSLAAGTPYTNTTAAALANASNLSPTPTVTTASGTDANGYKYIEVTVSYTFTTLINYPGLANTVPLSSKVRMMSSPL